MNNLLIVLVLLGLCIGLGESRLTLINQLEHNKLLKIDCWNDEGSWILMLKIGEEYTYPRQPPTDSLRGYTCSMEQGPNFKHIQDNIEALNARWSRGKGLDATCKWIAREDGIYFSIDGSPLLKRYEWE
ncbi:hypothetical protein BRARA_J02747 [Brassica rapa]|uniref:Uncharacterized protein n=2 Tax=Brassica TaxID=3705 RepID=A0A397XTT4_BRACM|nr:hypothetical protein BRARA_J02747 [Brassica rapa]CAF2361032.1 unnamed protein product [Brassica napus]CAG7912035.1 unnamed protein product [Brassica rapa]